MSNTKTRLPFFGSMSVRKNGWRWSNHEYQDVVEVAVVDDVSVEKMSGGDVHVEPYLDSRNTKGYGTATQILKDRSGNTCWGARRVSNGGGMRKWWWCIGGRSAYAEMWGVGGAKLKENSISSGFVGRSGWAGRPVVGRPVPRRNLGTGWIARVHGGDVEIRRIWRILWMERVGTRGKS